jgi:hypothetical protein
MSFLAFQPCLGRMPMLNLVHFHVLVKLSSDILAICEVFQDFSKTIIERGYHGLAFS